MRAAAHRPHESVPALRDPLAEDIGAPVGVALLDLHRRKEKCRARTRKVLAGAELVPARSADGAAVRELVGEVRMHGRANCDASAHVDIGRSVRSLAGTRPRRTSALVVAAESPRECEVRGRREADHFTRSGLPRRLSRQNAVPYAVLLDALERITVRAPKIRYLRGNRRSESRS